MHNITRLFENEIAIAVFLMIMLAAFISPLGLLMPTSSDMIILALFLLAFFLYLAVVWKERPLDEREHAHQLAAGRVSFFAGTSIVAAGIVVQAFRHDIDPWLVYALGFMLLTKIAVRIYTRLTH